MQKHLLVIVATSAISQALAQSVIGTLTGKKIGVLHASALGTDADEATVFTGTKDDLAEALARCGKDITVLDGGSAPSSGMPLSDSLVTLETVNDNVMRVLALVTPQDKATGKNTPPRARGSAKTAEDGKKTDGPIGEKGIDGPIGDPGPIGEPGPQGVPGSGQPPAEQQQEGNSAAE